MKSMHYIQITVPPAKRLLGPDSRSTELLNYPLECGRAAINAFTARYATLAHLDAETLHASVGPVARIPRNINSANSTTGIPACHL
jgi:hypothetical protein